MIHKDKIKHFLASSFLTALIYWLSQNLILAILVPLLFGLAKELYDQAKKKNTVSESIFDLGANILGIILGILVIYLVNLKL
ncbi:MAG: hypothetical protein WC675_00490 [Patescibacteria group bacterium]|jgi:hypothetical protein